VLRRIFGLKRDEIIAGWRKLHNELHILYSLPNIIRMIKTRRIRQAGHAACMGKKRNAYTVLVGQAEGKRPLRRYRSRWEDNIKISHREIEWGSTDWIDQALDRDQSRALVNTVMNLRVP
jgi:hypothetical protein